jgi:hypothetical protein
MVDPAGSCPAAFGLPPDSTAGHMAVVAVYFKYKYTSSLQAAAAMIASTKPSASNALPQQPSGIKARPQQ